MFMVYNKDSRMNSWYSAISFVYIKYYFGDRCNGALKKHDTDYLKVVVNDDDYDGNDDGDDGDDDVDDDDDVDGDKNK